ncbi:MAG TPA: cupin domain-containing protein [Roseiarcus sp.]|jgi:quercetin dioxygenase-like cupin family protein
MSISFIHSKGADAPIAIPAIGLDLFVRMAPAASSGAFSIIETINARGKGPPRHRHPEAEIFRVLEGRYLYEMDGQRFYAETGDVVSIPGGAEHGFVNVTDKPARQYILIVPALDAVAFFTELGGVMQNGVPDKPALNRFGAKWQVEFLGPRLTLADQPKA